MSYQENRELARLRAELRVRLMSRRYDGTRDILRRLKEAAMRNADESALHSEYERWKMRFDMLAAPALD